MGLGLSLRERLLPVLETFKGLQMWTLTVDPRLFATPAEAWEYVRDRRCIANTMRQLERWGYLHSKRYFVVVEWQRDTEMAHYHVLADASFIPFEKVCEAWNRFRPESAGPVQGKRPAFGSVRFSMPKGFKSPGHAACYACKYLIKYPEYGYPDWVLDRHDVHRYSTSRDFWAAEVRQADPAAVTEAPASESGDDALNEDPEAADAKDERSERRAIRERLAECGQRSVILRLVEVVDQATGELRLVREFVARLTIPVQQAAVELGETLADGQRRLKVLAVDARLLMVRFGDGEIGRRQWVDTSRGSV